MIKHRIKVSDCASGELLAEDIVIGGIKLVAKDTMLNSYILDKLQSYFVFDVLIYAQNEPFDAGYDEQIYEKIKNSYELSIKDVKSILNKMALGDVPDYNQIKELSHNIIELSNNGSDVIKYLNSLKQADEYTYTHCINVAIYALLIGKWMKLSNEKIEDLVQAGLLHDVGKIEIPEDILKKPGKLTNDEFSEIKKHTIYGFDIINQNSRIGSCIKDAILMHHERIDGSGYPLQLTSKDISLHTKIISVADVFDAMTSDRIYKKGATPFKTFEMFITQGLKLFDTGVLFTMLENLPAYYIGMKVVLDSGEKGEIVYIPPKNVLSPIIKVKDNLINFSEEDISRIVRIL